MFLLFNLLNEFSVKENSSIFFGLDNFLNK